MAELAVLGCTVDITSGQTATAKSITTSPSSNILVNGKGVYFGDIDVLLTAISFVSGETFTCASGTITISGTGSNVLEETKKAVLKGDSGSKELMFTGVSTGTQVPAIVTVKITDAGQTDVSTP